MELEREKLDNRKININVKIIKPTSQVISSKINDIDIREYYSNKEIQKILFNYSANREVCAQFGIGNFGKRPDTLNYPSDVDVFVQKGATSFHVSNEIWQNIKNLAPGMSQQQLNSQRIGWDMIIDIDCANKELFEISKSTAKLILKELDNYGVKSACIKFSGNKGFHIAIPWSAFPETIKGQKTSNLFPEAARNIATFLQYKVKNQLAIEITKKHDVENLIKLAGKTFEEVVERDGTGNLNPFTLVDIDTVLISPRHLYRMPYSLHEKTGLVSLPFDKSQIDNFNPSNASIEIVTKSIERKVELTNSFLKETTEKDATGLLLQSLDFCTNLSLKESFTKEQKTNQENNQEKRHSKIEGKFTVEQFPPCMKNILNGMGDGKKRAMFALMNFLKSVNWNDDEIEKLILDWNKKNVDKSEPLKEQYIKAQLRYAKMKKDTILPPNCKSYYEGLRVCTPDNICSKIKNPVGYPLVQVKINSMKKENSKTNNSKKEVKNKK